MPGIAAAGDNNTFINRIAVAKGFDLGNRVLTFCNPYSGYYLNDADTIRAQSKLVTGSRFSHLDSLFDEDSYDSTGNVSSTIMQDDDDRIYYVG